MLRKNMKTIGNIMGVATLIALPYQAHASCAEMAAEVDAYEGVSPKMAEDGSIRALVMYGEGTFLFADRSSISDARREAEMTARRAYSEFLNSNFNSDSQISKISQEYSKQNGEGMVEASREQLKTAINTMANNTASVQSGLVKLDECVDTSEKYVLVQLGWKPEFSEAAASAATKMAEGAAASTGQPASAKSEKATPTQPVSGYRKKSSLKDDF
jgi:hypothetical protein